MSKVNRSTYQKVVEENKKLKLDLKILCFEQDIEMKKLLIRKWYNHFKREEEIHNILIAHAKKYIREHKDKLPDFLTKDFKD